MTRNFVSDIELLVVSKPISISSYDKITISLYHALVAIFVYLASSLHNRLMLTSKHCLIALLYPLVLAQLKAKYSTDVYIIDGMLKCLDCDKGK